MGDLEVNNKMACHNFAVTNAEKEACEFVSMVQQAVHSDPKFQGATPEQKLGKLLGTLARKEKQFKSALKQPFYVDNQGGRPGVLDGPWTHPRTGKKFKGDSIRVPTVKEEQYNIKVTTDTVLVTEIKNGKDVGYFGAGYSGKGSEKSPMKRLASLGTIKREGGKIYLEPKGPIKLKDLNDPNANRIRISETLYQHIKGEDTKWKRVHSGS